MSNPRQFTLYCFPCAGASAVSYLSWRRLAPTWLRIEPVELPGRGSRQHEPSQRAFAALADSLTGSLAEQVAGIHGGNYALLGHSLGALFAFECARRLAHHNAAPTALFALCCAAPSTFEARSKSAAQSHSPNRYTDEDIVAELQHMGGTPRAIFEDAELLRIAIDTLAADLAVRDDYRYEPTASKLACPIYVYGGRDDSVSPAELSLWHDETCAPSTVKMFSGGHFFLREQRIALLSDIEHRIATACDANVTLS